MKFNAESNDYSWLQLHKDIGCCKHGMKTVLHFHHFLPQIVEFYIHRPETHSTTHNLHNLPLFLK